MTDVSVVMATYNGAPFVRQQLDSLAGQHHLPHELIVSDDGSSDGTLDIVGDFSRGAPFPVHVRRNARNLGYAENFLTATALATGDLVAFCDQDDVWCADKLSTAVDVLHRTGAQLFVHTASVIDEAGAHLGHFTQGLRGDGTHPPNSLGPWRVFYGFTMVFRRSLLDLVDASHRGRHIIEHQGMLSHDDWVYFLAGSLGHVAACSRPLASYRRHGRNVTPSVLARSFRLWTTSLGTAPDPGLPRDAIAAERADLLRDLADRCPDLADRALAAHRHWSSVAALESTRTAMYTDPSVTARVRLLAQLLWAGTYRSTARGGLRRRLLVKDALAGMLGLRRHRLPGLR